MKYINKISLLLFTAFILNSCAVNNDDPVVAPNTTNIEASINSPGIISIPDNSTDYNLTIDLSKTINNLGRLEYMLDGVAKELYIDSGSNSVSIPLDFSNSSAHKISITGFTVINSNPNDINTSIKKDDKVVVIKKTAIVATLTWEANRDLDLDLDVMTPAWSWAFSTLDSSQGITNTETVSSLLPDGNYALYINEFAFTADVPYNFEIVTSTGVHNFSGIVTADGWVLWLTKATDANGVISYTFYETDPS